MAISIEVGLGIAFTALAGHALEDRAIGAIIAAVHVGEHHERVAHGLQFTGTRVEIRHATQSDGLRIGAGSFAVVPQRR